MSTLWRSFLSRLRWLVLLSSAKFQTSIYAQCINCVTGGIFLNSAVFHFAWQLSFWGVSQKHASARTHPARITLKGRCLDPRAYFVFGCIHSDAASHLHSHLKHFASRHAQLEYGACDEWSLFFAAFFHCSSTPKPAMQYIILYNQFLSIKTEDKQQRLFFQSVLLIFSRSKSIKIISITFKLRKDL